MIEDKQLRENIATYFDDVRMPGGYMHNLPKTLGIIDAYYIGKYTGAGKDTDGTDLIFENITKPTVDVAEKLTDIDTKNILFMNNETPGIRYQVYKMQRRFKNWVKKNSLGNLLNDIGHNYPKIGHVVIKKGFDKKWKIAKIQNFRVNPGYEELKDMPFVYEIMEMDKRDIASMKWNGKDLKQIKDSPVTSWIVYECYDKNYDEGKKWKRTIRAGVFRKNTNKGIIETTEADYTKGEGNEYMASLVLHEDEIDDITEIYRELKWEKVDGRWLGLGFAELLIPEQIQTNTICYLSGKAMLQKAMHLYYTKDEAVGGNAGDYDFGQIIHTYDAVQPVNMSNNVDISAYRDIGGRVESLIMKKNHNTDIAMGETLPSQTPLGLGQLQASLTMSFFDKKREIFGLFVKDLIEKDYMPEFIRDNSKAHNVIFPKTSEEFEIMLQAYMEEFRTKFLVDHHKKTGEIKSWDEVERASKKEEDKIRSQGEVSFEMPESAYKDIDIEVDIEVTGEGVDVKTKQSIYQYAMSTLASNPQLMLNATTRELFFRLLEQTGESPVKMGLLREAVNPQEMAMAGGQMQGGSNVPAPSQPDQGAINLPGINTQQ